MNLSFHKTSVPIISIESRVPESHFSRSRSLILFFLNEGLHENGQKDSGLRQTAEDNGSVGRTRSREMRKLEALRAFRRREKKGGSCCSSKQSLTFLFTDITTPVIEHCNRMVSGD